MKKAIAISFGVIAEEKVPISPAWRWEQTAPSSTGGAGGAGGRAIQRNGYTVTTSGAGTTYGEIS